MLAANVWHWWIGIVLTLGIVLAVVVLIGAYLKSVTAQRHPSRAQRRHQHTDL